MQPNAITLTPDASDPNGLTTTQTLASSNLEFLLNGALASGLDRDGIAAAQTPTGAADLTLDGALGLAFPDGVRVTVFAGGDETGKTMTVTGTNKQGHKIVEVITGPNNYTVVSAATFYSITTVAASGATAGDVEIGAQGTWTNGTAQHITLTSAGNDSGRTFTVLGTDRRGEVLTEAITGGNTTIATGSKNFATVTKVTGDAATAAGVIVGVDGLCESGWVPLDYRSGNFTVGLAVELSSSAALTYTVEHTFNDVQVDGFVEDDATTHNHESLVTQTASADGNYTNPATAFRLALTAHTSGTATIRSASGLR